MSGPGANVIAGSDDTGILVIGGVTGNTIAGNFIGTNLGGTPYTTTPNAEGIRINPGGGTGNTISNNRISSSDTQGIEADAGPNTISQNTIDHNGGAGITIGPGTTGETISQNSIDLNTGLGIDIGNNGITPNGPSNLQNFPAGLAGTVFSSSVRVTGTLASAPNATYTLEFFASPAPDPSGNGEGAVFLGSIHVGTDGNGAATINALLTPSPMPAVGQWLSATATGPDGSTSEFATSVQLQAGTDTTVSIAPEADTFVDANQPGENFDTLDYSDVYGGSSPAPCVLADGMSYTLMRFDLSSLPAGATIVNAQLDTTTRAGYAQDGDPAHWALFLPDDSWDPTTVTWNTRPADGTASPGSSNATGGGDIRRSNLALGAADVFRASCGADNAGDQGKIFPSTSDGGLQSVEQGITNLADHITSQRAGDGKLSLELWTPSCLTNPNLCDPGHDNFAYWARYYTTRASDPKLRPTLARHLQRARRADGLDHPVDRRRHECARRSAPGAARELPVVGTRQRGVRHSLVAGRLDPGRLDPGRLDPGRLDPRRLDPRRLDRPDRQPGAARYGAALDDPTDTALELGGGARRNAARDAAVAERDAGPGAREHDRRGQARLRPGRLDQPPELARRLDSGRLDPARLAAGRLDPRATGSR